MAFPPRGVACTGSSRKGSLFLGLGLAGVTELRELPTRMAASDT